MLEITLKNLLQFNFLVVSFQKRKLGCLSDEALQILWLDGASPCLMNSFQKAFWAEQVFDS